MIYRILQPGKILVFLIFILVLLLLNLIRVGHETWDRSLIFVELSSKEDILNHKGEILLSQQQTILTLQKEIRQINGKQLLPGRSAMPSYIEEICRQFSLTLISLPQTKESDLGGKRIQTINFEVSGNYADLIRLLYQIEEVDQVANILSSDFTSKTIRINGQPEKYLLAKLSIQRLAPT